MSRFVLLRNLVSSSLHGLFWKLLSTFSKLYFLFVVVPKLDDGVFGEYSTVSSTALFLSVLLSFGAIDELPVQVGRLQRRLHWLRFPVQICLLLSIFCLGAYLYIGESSFLIFSLMLANLALLIVGGLIRAHHPGQYEVLINSVTLVFVLLTIVADQLDAPRLLLALTISSILVSVASVFWNGLFRATSLRQISYAKDFFVANCYRGLAKNISTSLSIANFRAVLLLPSILGVGIVTDQQALAIAAGEAYLQFAQILINRNYSKYVVNGPSLKHSLASCLALFVSGGTVAALLFAASNFWHFETFDLRLLGWGIMTFASVAVLLEVRSIFWAVRGNSNVLVALQVVFLILQASVLLLFPREQWILVLAFLTMLFAATAVVSVTLRYRRVP